MTRRPSRPVRVLASAVAAGTLLTSTACSDGGGEEGSGASDVEASPAAGESRAAAPLPKGSPTAASLTDAGARTALITEADIEDAWTQVKDAATWKDSLLVGKVDVAAFLSGKADAADCQKLLDSLYDEDLLGKPSGASALTGFEQGDSRLLYQVAAYDRANLDSSLAWLKSLPVKCDEFTVTDGSGGKRTVQVIETSLPDVGDARQGLQVTVKGTADDAPVTLTQGVAAVRVGTDAITVTAGGVDGGEADSVEQAVKQGTQRLKDVLAGRTPAPQPGEVD